MSLCSQISTSKTRNVKYTSLSLQRKRFKTFFPPIRLEMDVVNRLMNYLLSLGPGPHWAPPDSYAYPRLFLPVPLY